MKSSQNSGSSHNASGSSCVLFEYIDHQANEVCIAGTFNDWHPSATQMIPDGPGIWRKNLILPPGVYEYAFVVDGQWKPDPSCEEKVENSFGAMNSVVRVGKRSGRWP